MPARTLSPHQCINRNIVECKVFFSCFFIFGLLRINRNIVECKVCSDCYNHPDTGVLIETLWNVKVGLITVTVGLDDRINRNIVECKGHIFYTCPGAFECINRNIVECKAFEPSIHLLLYFVLIETLWNVKSSIAALNVLPLPY